MWFHVKNYSLQQLFIALFSEILLTYSYLHHLGISLGNAELGALHNALHISGEEKHMFVEHIQKVNLKCTHYQS